MSQEQTQPEQRTAGERLENLETAYISLYQTANSMAKDILLIKEAIKLLGNKTDSIVKASVRGEPLNDDTVSKIMIENNVEDLKSKVENYKFQGILVESEVADKKSFLVGKEVDDSGEVKNPRLQFKVDSFSEAIQDKLNGSKIGDIVNIEEGKLKFEVSEIYTIKEPAISPEVQQPADA